MIKELKAYPQKTPQRRNKEMEKTTSRTNVFETIEYGNFSYANYWDGEQNIIKPALEAKGFTNVKFFSLEADSFGPLIRGINTDQKEFFYG